MSDGFPARWLGEQLVARLDPVLARQGFQSGDALVWDGSPQETHTTVTWKRESDELTVRYEFWGGSLLFCLKSNGIEQWSGRFTIHYNEAVATMRRSLTAESIIGERTRS